MDRRIGTAFDRLRILERRIGRRRRIALIPHTRLRDRSDPMECFDAVQFKTRFHIFKDTALYIVDLIKGDLCAPLRRGTHIPPHIQFLIVQRFFCDGSFQLTTGDNYKVSQPTVSNLVKRVSTAIAKLRKKFIKYPTFAEAPVVRTAMYNIANDANSGTRGFPGIKLTVMYAKDHEIYFNLKIMYRSCWSNRWDPHPHFITRRRGCRTISQPETSFFCECSSGL